MRTLSNSALTLVSRLSNHLGPVTTMIDTLMDRLVGQQVAQACPGVWCGYSICVPDYLGQYDVVYFKEDAYAPVVQACSAPTCYQVVGFC